ncbi:EAL domain-containing protein [Sulfuriferula plumbiphila]|uniref:EAL domain-containing protein n=1 Tax=Sulfuriferula plumbiphila TaxID=171865 RepID=UPI001CB89898|nr:EAL domain-containing protein [Sulfuriferula plumbiphila]
MRQPRDGKNRQEEDVFDRCRHERHLCRCLYAGCGLIRIHWTQHEEIQLVLHYQPQIDLKSGRVIGAEALLRWHRPAGGMTLPAEFIPLAAETGLIGPIDEWVPSIACLACAWPLTCPQNNSCNKIWCRLSSKPLMSRDLKHTTWIGNYRKQPPAIWCCSCSVSRRGSGRCTPVYSPDDGFRSGASCGG